MFMGGKLATMLWEDGIQIVSGGDESNFTGDPVIADSHAQQLPWWPWCTFDSASAARG